MLNARLQRILTSCAPARTWWLTAAALALMTAFLLLGIPRLHMHPDEELSYRSTNGDFAFVIHWQQSYQDNQAPGWFLAFAGWRMVVGDAEWTSRVFSILCAMLALAVTARIARRAFRDSPWVGGFAILALIGNGFFFQYALDIRPYPLVMLVTALSFWALQRWLHRPVTRRAMLYGLCIAAMLYVHYLLAFVVVGQALFVLTSRRLTRTVLWQGLVAGALAAALFAPWFPTFVQQVRGLQEVESLSGTARGVAGIGVSTLPTTPDTVTNLILFATNGLPLVFAALLLSGVIVLWRRAGLWLAVTWAFVTPAVYLLVNLAAGVYAPRFVSHAMLGLALIVGAACAFMPRRPRAFPVGRLALIGLAALQLATFSSTLPSRVPYRDLYAQINASVQPGDVLAFMRAGEDDGFVAWQIRHYLDPALADTLTTDLDAAQASRRVWFVTGALFAEDVQSAFHTLEATHPVQQVIGDCTRAWCYVAQLMQAPPLREPIVFGGQLPLYGVDVDSVTPSQITARLWWRVEQAPAADYSIGLHLMATDGQLVAQTDGPIRHYDAETIQTSAMQPGRIYMDVRALSLPTELAAGTYRLAVIVYQSWDGARLALPDGTDSFSAAELRLPQ